MPPVTTYAEWSVVASATNGAATATRAAPTAQGVRHYITGVTISASAAPSAAKTALVRENAATTRDQIEVPASAFAAIPRNYLHPIRCEPGVSCDITLPALGVGVVGTVTIMGYTQ